MHVSTYDSKCVLAQQSQPSKAGVKLFRSSKERLLTV